MIWRVREGEPYRNGFNWNSDNWTFFMLALYLSVPSRRFIKFYFRIRRGSHWKLRERVIFNIEKGLLNDY